MIGLSRAFILAKYRLPKNPDSRSNEQILEDEKMSSKDFKIPREIQEVIQNVILKRIKELQANRGFFKDVSLTERKISRLNFAIYQIRNKNSVNDLKKLIHELKEDIDLKEQRSYWSLFHTKKSKT